MELNRTQWSSVAETCILTLGNLVQIFVYKALGIISGIIMC